MGWPWRERPRISIWGDPPQMDTGAPEPAAFHDGHRVWLAYRGFSPVDSEGQNDPAYNPGLCERFAVVRFDSVDEFQIGPPNDERLYEHRLWGKGLDFYSFHVLDTPRDGVRRWIITFHDETCEVLARSASVVARDLNVNTATDALNLILRDGAPPTT